TDAELVYGMAINFFAQFRICQRIVPMMIAQGGGRILNVSGETGIMTLNPPFLSSCTGPAKSAEIRFSKVLANELAPRNIRVNCVIPGFIHTPERFAKWEREMAKRQLSPDEAERERALWSSNQGTRDTRWGRPEEIAYLIVFAVSDAASYINGAELVADNATDKSGRQLHSWVEVPVEEPPCRPRRPLRPRRATITFRSARIGSIAGVSRCSSPSFRSSTRTTTCGIGQVGAICSTSFW